MSARNEPPRPGLVRVDGCVHNHSHVLGAGLAVRITMNRLHILLAIVAVLGFVVYPVSLVVTDTTPAQFEENTEDWETHPGPNAMWYVVAMMPMYYFAGIVAAGVLIVEWLSPKRWSGGSE